MEMPSNVLVPRPISSRTMRDCGRGVVEDVGGLLHLDHEGGAAAGEVVAGADAREDAVDDADFRRGGRNEAPHLRQDHDEGDLADVGGFAGHVGAGDDEQLVVRAVEERVVGDEPARLGQPLDDGMAAVADGRGGRRRSSSGARSGRRWRARRRSPAHPASAMAAAVCWRMAVWTTTCSRSSRNSSVFQGDGLVLGAEDLVFALLQLGRDEALAVDDGLLADVVRREPARGWIW